MFYPPREIRSKSNRGPIVFTCVLFWVRKGILDFQNMTLGEAFLKPNIWWILAKKQLFLTFETLDKKKIPPKWLETTLVSQKKTNLNFETTLVSQKKTIFKNTNVNRHVESAESTNSGQRRRPFWERKRVNVDQRCQQELVKWKIESRTRKSGLFSNIFLSQIR